MIDLTDLFSDSDDNNLSKFTWTMMDDETDEDGIKIFGWLCQKEDASPVATLIITIDNDFCSIAGTYKTINSFGHYVDQTDNYNIKNWQNKIDEIVNSVKLFKKAVEETSKIITIFNFDE